MQGDTQSILILPTPLSYRQTNCILCTGDWAISCLGFPVYKKGLSIVQGCSDGQKRINWDLQVSSQAHKLERAIATCTLSGPRSQTQP